MKKKAVSILCMVAMSIGSLGTEVVCAAESDFVLAKDPEDYKLTIYWPAPDTYFEENIQPGYQAVEEKYGVSFDYAIGTEWTQDIENQIVEAKAAGGYDLPLH